jgi:SsrA-binding protein
MNIQEYSHASHFNHPPARSRKLLLQRRELDKLAKTVQQGGNTIIPLKLYINERGLAKMTIALARGKKLHDKRETIKDRDNKRRLDQIKKQYR